MFLITAADDGSRLVYFIAQNTRHSTLPGDLQLEQALNSLWPVRIASRDEVLAFPEAAPVGSARTGLLDAPVIVEPSPINDAPVAEAPVAAEAPVVAEVPVVAEAPVAAESPVPVEPSVVNSQPVASDSALYVLRSGDNLTRISAKYSTTIPAILAANGLTDANRIYVGHTLLIPGIAAAPEDILAAPITAPVQTIVESPAAPLPVAAEPEPVIADVPASADAMTYTVKAGDSAIHIARQFGVDVDELLAANGVVNRNRVYTGQLLSIPAA